MHVVRFSAVEMFGIPIDAPRDAADPDRILELMDMYGIEPTEVTPEPTNITPYYWEKNELQYWLSRRGTDGPALVEILPVHPNSITSRVSMVGEAILAAEVPYRTLEIPTTDAMMAITGGSPRFAGKLCIHEVITALG